MCSRILYRMMHWRRVIATGDGLARRKALAKAGTIPFNHGCTRMNIDWENKGRHEFHECSRIYLNSKPRTSEVDGDFSAPFLHHFCTGWRLPHGAILVKEHRTVEPKERIFNHGWTPMDTDTFPPPAASRAEFSQRENCHPAPNSRQLGV